MANSIKYSPFPAWIGASNWSSESGVDDAANTIALSFWSLLFPRLIPCWTRSSLVKFFPESTWRSMTRNPFVVGQGCCCLKLVFLDVEDVGAIKRHASTRRSATNEGCFSFAITMNGAQCGGNYMKWIYRVNEWRTRVMWIVGIYIYIHNKGLLIERNDLILTWLTMRKNGDFFVTFPSNVVERIKRRRPRRGVLACQIFLLRIQTKYKRGEWEREGGRELCCGVNIGTSCQLSTESCVEVGKRFYIFVAKRI